MPTVLIVDDEPTNISVINSLLREEYRTLVATSGKRALDIAHSAHPPDLILLDVGMPEMDGYQVCQALKEDPLTRHIPVIFTTGKTTLDDELRGFEMGCADYIHKPISPPVLKARVRTQMLLIEANKKLRLLDPG